MRRLHVFCLAVSVVAVSRAEPNPFFKFPHFVSLGASKTYSSAGSVPYERHHDTTFTQTSFRKECGIVPAVKLEEHQEDRTVFGEHPWQIAILEEKVYNHRVFCCSGALLSSTYVITSATCVHEASPRNLRVLLGDWDLGGHNCKECYPQLESGVSSVIVFPEFHHYRGSGDVALLRLDTEVDFDLYPHIVPVCLPVHVDLPNQTPCYVAGWGESQTTASTCPIGGLYHVYNASRLLEQASVQQESRDWCRRTLERLHVQLPYGQTCLVGKDKNDPCKADIGSPVVCRVRQHTCPRYARDTARSATTRHEAFLMAEPSVTDCYREKAYLLGIVSFAYPCDESNPLPVSTYGEYGSTDHQEKPAVKKPCIYTRVSHFLKFVKDHLSH